MSAEHRLIESFDQAFESASTYAAPVNLNEKHLYGQLTALTPLYRDMRTVGLTPHVVIARLPSPTLPEFSELFASHRPDIKLHTDTVPDCTLIDRYTLTFRGWYVALMNTVDPSDSALSPAATAILSEAEQQAHCQASAAEIFWLALQGITHQSSLRLYHTRDRALRMQGGLRRFSPLTVMSHPLIGSEPHQLSLSLEDQRPVAHSLYTRSLYSRSKRR